MNEADECKNFSLAALLFNILIRNPTPTYMGPANDFNDHSDISQNGQILLPLAGVFAIRRY